VNSVLEWVRFSIFQPSTAVLIAAVSLGFPKKLVILSAINNRPVCLRTPRNTKSDKQRGTHGRTSICIGRETF
jgi:hypothetical protein